MAARWSSTETVMAHPPLHLGDALGATRAAFARSFARPDLLSWLVANLLAERERWLLWLPVGLGAGIAGYFALPLEPPLWLGATGLLLATLLLAWSGWRLSADAFHSCAPGLLGLVVVLLGFTVATLAHAPGRGAGAGSARRVRTRGHGPARGRSDPRSAPSARRAEHRGNRGERDPGPHPGQHTQRGAVLRAGRSRPAARAAHGAFAAGRAGRVRLRAPGLVREPRRGGLRPRRAGTAVPRRSSGLVARPRGPAPDDRARDHSSRPRHGGRDRRRAADRPARRAAGPDLGPVGDRRHRPSPVHLRAPPGPGRRHPVLCRPRRARARAAARPAASDQEAGGPGRAARRLRLPAALRSPCADAPRLRHDRASAWLRSWPIAIRSRCA